MKATTRSSPLKGVPMAATSARLQQLTAQAIAPNKSIMHTPIQTH